MAAFTKAYARWTLSSRTVAGHVAHRCRRLFLATRRAVGMSYDYRHSMENFTPVASTVGGALIGLSATVLLLFYGRIAGISGIFWGALSQREPDSIWRWAFLGGLLLGGLGMSVAFPSLFAVTHGRTLWMIALAGILVGVGVRLGSGCTSGHGVCGLSRLSPRSLVATLSFIATGALTVLVVRLLSGGAS